MAKKNIRYGIIDIPQNTVLCTMEKGGDSENKARYRFSDTGKRTSSRLVALVSDETVMTDLYGAPWAHTDKGWVKAEDKITWCNSYKEASEKLASLTNRKRKIILWILTAVLVAVTVYLVYRHFKNTADINPIIETPETPIPDEIPMD